MFVNFKGNQAVPDLFVSFILGSVLAIFISFFINNFTKLSLHMVGMGGLILALILMKTQLDYNSLYIKIMDWFGMAISIDFLIIIAVLLAGLTASSRLYLKAHVPQEIYLGFFVGILTQLFAFNIIF